MAIIAPAMALRNMLRTSLTNFYDQTAEEFANANDLTGQVKRRKESCKIMPDHRPAPNCGREFIAIYNSHWGLKDSNNQYAFHEVYAVTIAVTHRYGDVPFDRLGEAAYGMDEDVFVQQYVPLSNRIREIVKIIHPDYVNFRAQMDAILKVSVDAVDKSLQDVYDKLWFAGADPRPTIVGPDHFHAENSSKAPSGLMMKVHFASAGRLNWIETLDSPEA